jgi:hypothetical protein
MVTSAWRCPESWREAQYAPDYELIPHAFHATEERHLRSIARRGLVPKRQPVCHSDEDRCTNEKVVFLTAMEEHASMWGDVLLRFPWPPDLHRDRYSDCMGVDFDITDEEATKTVYVLTSYFTHRRIPPEKIEVLVNEEWRPVRSLFP